MAQRSSVETVKHRLETHILGFPLIFLNFIYLVSFVTQIVDFFKMKKLKLYRSFPK